MQEHCVFKKHANLSFELVKGVSCGGDKMAAAPAKTPIVTSWSSSFRTCYLLITLLFIFHFLSTAAADTKRDYVALNPAHLKPSPFCSAPKGNSLNNSHYF